MGAYLQRSRHGAIFYFRRKLPIDLRDRVDMPQLFLSLGTADRPIAMLLAHRAALTTRLNPRRISIEKRKYVQGARSVPHQSHAVTADKAGLNGGE